MVRNIEGKAKNLFAVYFMKLLKQKIRNLFITQKFSFLCLQIRNKIWFESWRHPIIKFVSKRKTFDVFNWEKNQFVRLSGIVGTGTLIIWFILLSTCPPQPVNNFQGMKLPFYMLIHRLSSDWSHIKKIIDQENPDWCIKLDRLFNLNIWVIGHFWYLGNWIECPLSEHLWYIALKVFHVLVNRFTYFIQ